MLPEGLMVIFCRGVSYAVWFMVCLCLYGAGTSYNCTYMHRRPKRAPRAPRRCVAPLRHMAPRPLRPRGHVTYVRPLYEIARMKIRKSTSQLARCSCEPKQVRIFLWSDSDTFLFDVFISSRACSLYWLGHLPSVTC